MLLHGHCQQKAVLGTSGTLAALRRIPDLEVRELDSGCCGMAGSFGFNAEHYDLSMKIAEDKLLPLVRTASAQAVVVTNGFSCREQIEHGTGRKPLHIAQLARMALDAHDG